MTILGGYLGSGKTTWLRHQLHGGHFGGALVIVNEAARTPVDDALLHQASRLAVLAGGCCCCDGKADLLSLLRAACDERSRIASTESRLSDIVLETSGLADPGAIAEAIGGDPVLVNHIVVSDAIVAVDGLHGLEQLTSEPLGRRQIEAASRFIVTKVDEVVPKALARLLATVARLNPEAPMTGAIRGADAPLPSFSGAEPHALPELAGAEARPPPFPVGLTLGIGADWAAFSVWLSALLHARGGDVVRVKGVVRTPAGRLLVQTVRRVVQSPEILPELPEAEGRDDNTIVVIGRGYRPEDLALSLRRFAGG